jgi:hypothetical protein
LNEGRQEIEEAFLSQTTIAHTARGVGLYRLLDAFKLLSLQRRIEAFSLS